METAEEPSDFIEGLQELAIAFRLRRLSDQFTQASALIYQVQKIPFEPAWFLLFYLLNLKSPLSLMEIAQHLQITHSAVSQLVSELTRQGLVDMELDASDKRKRLIRLSPTGQERVAKLIPLWKEMKTVMQEHLISTGYDVLDVLSKLEQAATDYPMSNRLFDRLVEQQNSKTEIVAYAPQYKLDFERLNRQWLEKYFTVEPIDLQYFKNPEAEILQKGGHIFFAIFEGRVVGTCALLPHEDELTYEFAKMAVDDPMQGRQVGEQLLKTAIQAARDAGKTRLFLEMNSQFIRSVQLYRKFGFILAPFEGPPKYKRSDSLLTLSL